MKEKIVAGFDSVSTKVPAKHCSKPAAAGLRRTVGRRRVPGAPGQPQQEGAAAQRQRHARADQRVDHPADAEGADRTVQRIGHRRAQPGGQADERAALQRALDHQQADRAHRRGDRQADQQRLREQRGFRHLRRSAARQAVHGQRVAVDAEADDDAGRRRRQVGMVAEGLARVHVADVHLDHRHARALDGVVQRHAGVGVGAGVEDHAQQRAGAVGALRPRGSSRSARLRGCSGGSRPPRPRRLAGGLAQGLHVGQRGAAVDGGLARAQQVEVGAVEDRGCWTWSASAGCSAPVSPGSRRSRMPAGQRHRAAQHLLAQPFGRAARALATSGSGSCW